MPTRRSAGCPVTSVPSTNTRPLVGRIKPAIAFSSVDLPAPLGPTIAVIAPRRALTLTFSTTGGPPQPAVSPSTVRAAPSSGAWLLIRRHLAEVGVDHGRVRA